MILMKLCTEIRDAHEGNLRVVGWVLLCIEFWVKCMKKRDLYIAYAGMV